MDKQRFTVKQLLLLLIVVSTAIRLILAGTLEFSVDEVYYWTYALFPDWSHFEHPPMVGLVIQFFTLNLHWNSELFIRLGAIVFSAINTVVIFKIGTMIKDEYAGLFAAFLFNTSIYCSVLAGTFILPDTPQLLFWLLSIFFLSKSIVHAPDRHSRRNWLMAGLCIGLATLSKYHGVFIGLGAFLYVVIFNRSWLKQPVFYLGILLALLCITPIVYWNFENHFITFTFHGHRVTPGFALHPEYFLREVVGQFAYNNPVNYIIIIMAMIAVWKGTPFIDKKYFRLLLLNGLPLWALFTVVSLFRETLPHWSAPAFTPLLIIASVYLSSQRIVEQQKTFKIPGLVKSAACLIIVLAFLAIGLINYLPACLGNTNNKMQYGSGDVTLDMFGWYQIRHGFDTLNDRLVGEHIMQPDAPIVCTKYYQAAFLDYYVATPDHKKLFAFGPLPDIHKYAWINEIRGEMHAGENAYFITTSNYYIDPQDKLSSYFQQIQLLDTLEIHRSGTLVYYTFIYKLTNYQGNYDFNIFDN